jgi:recombination protein RecA
MPAAARAALETLLREHKLDRTLTSALPERWDDRDTLAPTGLALLDAHLQGGLPRGQLSEIVGPASSGRTSLALALAGAATRRGELVAFIDTLDRGDAASMARAGIDPSRFLWVRGDDVPLSRRALAPGWEPSRPRPGRARGSLAARALDRAIKATNLVLQAGGFGLVVLDLADVPLDALRDLPFTTWMRLQRVLEGGDAACVLVGAEAMARSADGVSLRLQRRGAPPRVATSRPPVTATAPRERDDAPSDADGDRPRADTGETQRFREAVLASRRPFVGQPQSPASVSPGRWTGEAPWARRFRGLTSEAVAVRAHRRGQTTRQVPLEFRE